MIRFFALVNEYGGQYELNSPDTGIFTEPQGLGYELNVSYANIGSGFIKNFMKEKQQTITGTLVLDGAAAYTKYQALADFINHSQSIKLLYSTAAGDYYRDVDIVSLGKSEVSQKRVLECPIKFVCRSLFYSNHVNRFKIERVEGEVRWDFRWDVRFNDYGSRTLSIDNNGHVPAPFELELYGYCENPKVIVSQNKKEIASCTFPTTLQTDEKIIYSSLDGNLYCYRVDKNGNQVNFTDKLDIHNTNFFKLPVGDCVIDFTSDTGAANKTILTVYKFFRTV